MMTPDELQRLRLELGWSTEETARRLGLSPRGYRYHEAGRTSRGRRLAQVPTTVALALLALRVAAARTIGRRAERAAVEAMVAAAAAAANGGGDGA
jgi:hypothetical protein